MYVSAAGYTYIHTYLRARMYGLCSSFLRTSQSV